ncbi:MAG TPA: MazG nucleotide pyrophosphohydrolase domain-containing protein [Aeromicrobium sp.]|nr:MazG nucleotide pyrophosphohydrolase domain-containing protein [Aeromicrobium sp.]
MRILVLSPRIPAGLMTASAWDALRAAPSVVATSDGPHVQALREAGIDVVIGPRPPDDAIWMPDPGDSSWAADLAERMLDSVESDDEFEIITGSFDPAGARFLDLVEVMRRLRRDCAWTREQTHESLAPYLAEESQETLEAIGSGDVEHLREELGDLLLQVVFHAEIGDDWDVDDVAAGITEKLIRRNPHVFGDSGASTIDEIAEQWERIKAQEKHGR